MFLIIPEIQKMALSSCSQAEKVNKHVQSCVKMLDFIKCILNPATSYFRSAYDQRQSFSLPGPKIWTNS